LYVHRDDLGQLQTFLKETKDDNVRSLEVDVITTENKTKEALLTWFKLLPSAYNKKVKDCSDVFVCSVAHLFFFHEFEDFERLDDILHAIYNVELTAFADFIHEHFSTQNTLCDPNIGNEDIGADADFIVNNNEISEMKVFFLPDEYFFPQLIGYTALAKPRSKTGNYQDLSLECVP